MQHCFDRWRAGEASGEVLGDLSHMGKAKRQGLQAAQSEHFPAQQIFAAGQIVGPGLVGRIADGPGGLARGFLVSAAVLALGSLLAWLQRPVGTPAD